jgi:hypothetical protein
MSLPNLRHQQLQPAARVHHIHFRNIPDTVLIHASLCFFSPTGKKTPGIEYTKFQKPQSQLLRALDCCFPGIPHPVSQPDFFVLGGTFNVNKTYGTLVGCDSPRSGPHAVNNSLHGCQTDTVPGNSAS